MKPITLTISAACRCIGIGQTKLYELINDGSLDAVKLGRRTLVTTASIERLFGHLATPA